jgi:hypothetical protein
VSNEKNKPHPEHSVRLFIYSGRAAAGGQLETAITLWFEEKDKASIHTLAVAAQGLLNKICKDRRIKPSQINELVETLMDKKTRIAMRAPQNFFKHGAYTGQQGESVTHVEMWTELILIDCVSMHQRLFGVLTPMMLLYAFRYSLFNPGAFPTKVEVKGIKIEDLRRLSRPEFMEKVLPRLRAKVGDLSAHLGKPPEWTEKP